MQKVTKKTSDIYLAAAFLALGARLVDTDKEDPRHMQFGFSDEKVDVFKSEVLESAVKDASYNRIKKLPLDDWETQWANETLMVPATKYADSIKKLKSIVHTK